jgi:hypothetical protein
MEPPSPPRRPHARARRGSLERPINGRGVRGTLLLVALPLLLAAFTVARPPALPPPALPPLFDADSAAELAGQLARDHPDRVPGSAGAARAADGFSRQLSLYGFPARTETWRETIPGLGEVELRNVSAVISGRSPETIVVMANRDTDGSGPGASDNASGTAALIELARVYAAPDTSTGRARPEHTIVLVSTDAGSWGALGALRFATTAPQRDDLLAVVSLRGLASEGRPRLAIAGDAPLTPAAELVRTTAVRVLEQTGDEPARPSALRQLAQLGFPVALGEQAPFVARSVPAITVGTAPAPASGFEDAPELLGDERVLSRYGQLGRAAESLVVSLDGGLAVGGTGGRSYLYLGERIVRGWTVQLVLISLLAPFLVGAVDLFARLRRRHIPLVPAVRSLRSRLGFWAYLGVVLLGAKLVGLLPSGPPRPLSPNSDAAHDWPVAGLVVIGLAGTLGWLVVRERLLPRRTATAEERLAGYAVGLLGLAVVGVTTLALNPYALVFLVPALYAWLWLPQLADGPAWSRAALLVLGLLGPALALVVLARALDLGVDVIPYTLRLFTSGYASSATAVVLLGWAAVTGQLAALAAGRYAPYPSSRDQRPRGPLRRAVRRLVLARRARSQPDTQVEVGG